MPSIGVLIRFPAAFADHAGSIMKGPAYVADAYRLDDAETPHSGMRI
jgi:hypothetical protein